MDRKWFAALAVALALMGAAACTKQQMAKSHGGTMAIDLPECTKLTMITWKEDNLWILQRRMHAGESAEEYQFKENSSMGILEGTVVIKEHLAPNGCFPTASR